MDEEVTVIETALFEAGNDLGKINSLLSILENQASCYESEAECFADGIKLRIASIFARFERPKKAERLLSGLSKVKAKHYLANLRLGRFPVWHFAMLNDKRRNAAFKRAIKGQCDGKKVVDIGSGSGILSHYAKEQKAESVFAVEANETMAEISKRILHSAKNGNVIKVIEKLSTHVDAETEMGGGKADLLITETFDCGLLGEHALEILDHAWKYLINSAGKVIPHSARLFISAVECDRFRSGRKSFAGLKIPRNSAVKTEDEPYFSLRFTGGKMLSEAESLTFINFNDPQEVEKWLKAENLIRKKVEIIDEGFIDGILLWFNLNLNENCSCGISSGPEMDSCWEQAFFPLKQRIEVKRGHEAEFRFRIQGHVSLIDDEEENPKSFRLHQGLIDRLNDLDYADFLSKVIIEGGNILDLTSNYLLSLNILKKEPNSVLNIPLPRENAKETLDFLIETAESNGIDSGMRINVVPENPPVDEKFDLVICEPVESSGLLNESLLNRLKSLPDESRIYPSRVRIFVEVVEAGPKILETAKVNGENLCLGQNPELASHFEEALNSFSVEHLQDMTFNDNECKRLTEDRDSVLMVDVSIRELTKSFQKVKNVKLIRNGQPNCIFYWFQLSYENVSLCTLKASSFNQACFIVHNDSQQKGQAVTVKLTVEDGILDIQLV